MPQPSRNWCCSRSATGARSRDAIGAAAGMQLVPQPGRNWCRTGTQLVPHYGCKRNDHNAHRRDAVAEAARRIDVAPATVREWIASGRLGRFHAGRELRVNLAELETLLRTAPEGAPRSPEEEARAFLLRRGNRAANEG